MSKRPKSILTIEGELKVAGQSMFPRPGKVDFRIEGADKLIGKLLSIDAGSLPPVATQDHLYGRIAIEIFAKEVDNTVGVAPVPPTRVPGVAKTTEEFKENKPEITGEAKDEIQQTTPDPE